MVLLVVNNMMIIKGKYTQANVMIDSIDESTYSQILNLVNNSSFKDSYIAIMPDCHCGNGVCIGFTMHMKDRIIPNIVGVDIGCGMLSAKFDIEHLDVEKFDIFIKENIPSGFSINKNNDIKVPILGGDPDMMKKIGMDEERFLNSIGTLGGGNHFIEAGYGEDKKIWVTIHSGSRNFGLKIANYHSNVAKAFCERNNFETKGIPFLLVDSEEGEDYLVDQEIAVLYAQQNRESMMSKIESFIGKSIHQIESVHNFVGENGMIRKGATSANKGEIVIIPFNMRDGLAICEGKGNHEYNYSAPHGAGRILSRSKAKSTLDVEYFVEDMKQAGVYTTTADITTIDESPSAYKDMSVILENIKDTVDVVEMIKPIYNFKAGSK